MSDNDERLWTVKGATISDKTARKEYNLTQEQIIKAIKEGKLHYRVNYIYGNPWYRLLRAEVEKLVKEIYGQDHLMLEKLKTELNNINKELKTLKAQTQKLEFRKKEIQVKLGI